MRTSALDENVLTRRTRPHSARTSALDENVLNRRKRRHSTRTSSLDKNALTRRKRRHPTRMPSFLENVIIRQERPHTTRRSSLDDTVLTRLVLSLDECLNLQLDASRPLASSSLLDLSQRLVVARPGSSKHSNNATCPTLTACLD